jgi:N-acetylmuramoyl-L-alanine amidase
MRMLLVCVTVVSLSLPTNADVEPVIIAEKPIITKTHYEEPVKVVKPRPVEKKIDTIKEIATPEPEIGMSVEDIELIALVTMAEAEGECEEGKRLVIDTILNRVDSKHFPNTVHDVIYQKNQFTSMWNGRVDKCYVTDYICQLVREELVSRMNYDTVFFTAGMYGKYGVPMFQVGNHYFSSYD